MLSHELTGLYHQFKSWISGDGEAFTVDAARDFERKLKHGAAKAALLELGVDPRVFDTSVPFERIVPVETGSPPAQLLAFPIDRVVRRPQIGGDAR
ncbi:hypothetical protein [Rhodopseudomonas sp.]|uniref:hypothetical protein n=1 Tax=Rhodopseudomonas sp. TaxID=1078 RepID=UPI003B3B6E18